MNLILFTAFWVLGTVDLQETVKGAVTHGSVILPPTTAALPEEQAWNMIAAEGGAMAVLLAIGIVVLWRLVSRILNETREQNSELMKSQVDAINRLGETMGRVQAAVRESDINNQHAVGKLTDSVNAATARLDKHESKLEAQSTNLMEHSHRLQILESGSHLILPPGSGRPTTNARNKKPGG